MAKILGQFHALSFSMKFSEPEEFERMKNGIIPLPFIDAKNPLDQTNNLYHVLYRVAFDRFFGFLDTEIINKASKKQKVINNELTEKLTCLREKYFLEPTKLLEKIYRDVVNSENDRLFSAILYGDYNSNNVLFRSNDSNKEKLELKIIDFQVCLKIYIYNINIQSIVSFCN